MPDVDIEHELREIRAANNGVLTAQAIVAAARPQEHPLHSRFEWDADVAAEKYRLQQARNLVRVVRLQYINKRGEPDTMRVFHSVPQPRSGTGRSYEPLDVIQADQIMTQTLRRQMEVDWRALLRRWRQFSDFAAMVRTDLGPEEPTGSEPLPLGDDVQS
jgi:hypothetical protein